MLIGITMNYWALGNTITDVKKNIVRVGGKDALQKYGCVVKKLPDNAKDVCVSNNGEITWTGDPAPNNELEVVHTSDAYGERNKW